MGEPWTLGIDMSDEPKAAVESFLKECGIVKNSEFYDIYCRRIHEYNIE